MSERKRGVHAGPQTTDFLAEGACALIFSCEYHSATNYYPNATIQSEPGAIPFMFIESYLAR